MFELSLYNRGRDSLRKSIKRALRRQATVGNRAANDTLIKLVGVNVSITRDELYCQEALDYHLGLVYAHIGDVERSALHLERSNTLPTAGGNLLFSDHMRDSLDLFRRQQEARERGIPSILIASMPRSASATLTQTIAGMLNIPVMRVSVGDFPHYAVIARWLNSFSPGGAVTHDHFGASAFNLRVLKKCQVKEVFVLVRDPRAATASALQLRLKSSGRVMTNRQYEKRLLNGYRSRYVPWLHQWIAAADSNVQVNWLDSMRVRTQPDLVLTEIFERLAPLYPNLQCYSNGELPEIKANYVVGNDDGWRDKVSDKIRRQLWDAMPKKIADLLQLRP